jgi:hypothetical protein
MELNVDPVEDSDVNICQDGLHYLASGIQPAFVFSFSFLTESYMFI